MQAEEIAWVPIAEAARRLGVSMDTVRRRLKRGELPSERRETPQGFVWWVNLDPLAEDGAVAAYADAELGGDAAHADADLGSVPHRLRQQIGSTMPPRRQGSEAPHLASLVRELQGEVLRRTEAATTWQVRAEILAHQLANAEDRIKMLEGPKTDPEPDAAPAPTPFPTPNPPTPNVMPESAPSWWRRWWAALAGAGLALAVIGSSCRPTGVAASRPNLCPAAQQHLAVFDRIAGQGRAVRPDAFWMGGSESPWPELAVVAAFIKDHC